MIVNGKNLLICEPIVNMISTKEKFEGTSYGLSEAGYDIRIKQDIEFINDAYKRERSILVTDPETLGTKFVEGTFVLASTIEEFQMPTNLVGTVKDKSSWARRGLSVFNTVIEPGWNGFLTLELVYNGQSNMTIKAGSGIAQVLFSMITDHAEYTGKYQNQPNTPVKSRV